MRRAERIDEALDVLRSALLDDDEPEDDPEPETMPWDETAAGRKLLAAVDRLSAAVNSSRDLVDAARGAVADAAKNADLWQASWHTAQKRAEALCKEMQRVIGDASGINERHATLLTQLEILLHAKDKP